MKKIARIITSATTIATIALLPGAVRAQGVVPIEVGSSATTPPTTTTDTVTTAGIPNTGIAPAHNKVFTNSLVFIGGSALGAGLGFGYLTMRKKRLNQ